MPRLVPCPAQGTVVVAPEALSLPPRRPALTPVVTPVVIGSARNRGQESGSSISGLRSITSVLTCALGETSQTQIEAHYRLETCRTFIGDPEMQFSRLPYILVLEEDRIVLVYMCWASSFLNRITRLDTSNQQHSRHRLSTLLLLFDRFHENRRHILRSL